MGTAMAHAAAFSIPYWRTLNDPGQIFSDYDAAVFTGDLASIGLEIVTRMFEGPEIKVRNYYDAAA
jgi:hypothetical protein